MAARPSARTAPNTPLLNRPSNGSATSRTRQLPTGRCNYTNLSVGGTSPPRCGCQRFWDRSEHTRAVPETRKSGEFGWCHCTHHACFHESVPAENAADELIVASASLRTVSQQSSKRDGSIPSHSGDQFPNHEPRQQDVLVLGNANNTGIEDNAQAEGHHQLTEGELPDTSSWGPPTDNRSGAQGFPPIPSECLLPSDISSGDISGNSQSFASIDGHDLHSLFHSHSVEVHDSLSKTAQPDLKLVTIQQDVSFDNFIYSGSRNNSFNQSATELMTPSPRGSPDLGATSQFDQQTTSMPATVDGMAQAYPRQRSDFPGDNQRNLHLSNATTIAIRPASEPHSPERTDQFRPSATPVRQLVPHLQTLMKHVSAHAELVNRIENHEVRLDNLENASFSNSGVDEAHEEIGLFGIRISEIETRIDDVEKAQAAYNDMSSVTSSRRIDNGNGSMISETSSAMIAAAIDRAALSNRLGNLESQLTDLRSITLPSYTHPWTIEVVYLPFGPRLRGIWSTLDVFHRQRSRQNSMAADELQTPYSAVTGGQSNAESIQSPLHYHPRWEGVHHPIGQDEWLVPRACRQGSKVEERLRSRGLVKQIEIKGPDARDVHVAMISAFGDLPRKLGSGSRLKTSNILQQYHGLQTSWIPLRKLHKDSRLQLLDTSEMVTPALWNVTFLSSSVVMRAAGIKRLYVTQRESYLQPGSDTVDWTWQKLRVLPRVFSDTEQSMSEVGEADAMEACWEYDSRLDPPPSVQSSFRTHHSSLSIRNASEHDAGSSQSSNQSFAAGSPILSTTPTSVAPARAFPPLIERRIRPFHSRTTSMPAMMPLNSSPMQSKRRIASFDHEAHLNDNHSLQSSPVRQQVPLSLKRRRISRSPSRPRNTPRWSVGPPSPSYFEEPVDAKRGTTPFAYATPHSNTPYVDFNPHSVAGMTADDEDNDYIGSTTDEAGVDGENMLNDNESDEYEGDDQGHEADDEAWEGVGEGVNEGNEEAGQEQLVDEDWDQEHRALSENEDKDEDDDDDASDGSSQPSEYPSKQPSALYSGNKGVFHIHVDENDGQIFHGGRPRS